MYCLLVEKCFVTLLVNYYVFVQLQFATRHFTILRAVVRQRKCLLPTQLIIRISFKK